MSREQEKYIFEMIEWAIEEYALRSVSKTKKILKVIKKQYRVNISYVEFQTVELTKLCNKYGIKTREQLERRFSSALWLCANAVMKEKSCLLQ